jgi:hypothetical protein
MTDTIISKKPSAMPPAPVAAALALLDRGHGKPVQEIDGNVSLSVSERIERALARIADAK